MAQARESKLLITALKRCLKLRGVTYKDLALSINLSESSVKRLFASNNLSLQRFEQVCEVVGMSIFDLPDLGIGSGRSDNSRAQDEKMRAGVIETRAVWIRRSALLPA